MKNLEAEEFRGKTSPTENKKQDRKNGSKKILNLKKKSRYKTF